MKIRNKALLKTIFALQGNLRTGIRPQRRVFDEIEIAPFKHDARAAVCVAADFELSWAFRHEPLESALAKGKRERENVPAILQILEDYNCPITWATVGHLFLENCVRGSKGLAHAEMPRPHHNPLWEGDWYMHDPCTNYMKDPCWYAPDLIQSVLQSPIGHEIGSHSFSHANLTPDRADPTLVRREVEESAAVMGRFGITPRSLVYPYTNRVHAFLDLLSELSITAVRKRDQRLRLSYPERTPSGVYKIYESMLLRSSKHYDYVDKAKIFLATAARRHAVFHLWFHPSDASSIFMNEFRRILQYIDGLRKTGIIWIATMAEIAAYCEARERLQPSVERSGHDMKISLQGNNPGPQYGYTELTLIMPALPRPYKATLIDENGSRSLHPDHFHHQKSTGRLLITMPTAAKALHLVF